MFTIAISEKGGKKQRIECTKPSVTIGRMQGNDIVLPLGNVSKKHAEIQQHGDLFTLVDIGSTNGTYLNGRKISGPTPIEPGDKVYVGEFMVSIESNGAEEGSDASISVARASRPPIPPPKPKTKKSVPPPASEKPRRDTIADTEDTLTSIDESAFPDIISDFKIEPKKPLSIPPGPTRSSAVPLSAPVEQLIDFVTIEERAIDRTALPSVTDANVAGHVRKILSTMIEQLHREDQIPKPYTKGSLFMESFLSVVDLGPLSRLLRDKTVQEIRINGRDNLHVVTANGPEKMSQVFKNESQLVSAIRCLTAGLRRGFSPTTGGKFRLENGDLVLFQPTGIAKSPTAIIRKAAQKATLQEEPLQLIRDCLNANGSIIVGGNCLLTKLTVMEKILDEIALLRVVCVEPNPLLLPRTDEHLHFCLPSTAETGTSFEQLLFDSVQFSPNHVCARTVSWTDVPSIIRFGALHTPLIAELPLGDSEYTTEAVRAGLFSSGGDAEHGLTSLADTFQILITCSAAPSTNLIHRIFKFKNDGKTAPQLSPIYISEK
ncbi:MAG: FHA domain-containing protein [Deltaproteobacteria bacterium]|nr:FHA domain-containing protein [Deltaproteobacteria bacterium]MBN2672749.1 FHA domain-containing protein [Deltaproteobacteria bacterium]